MERQRIEYIDAMRGFTMILVVYSHVCSMCFGDSWMGFNDIFFLFRLPCFFFISGWLFEQVGRQWDVATIRQTVRHKFMVQIVPTFIFLLILAPPPLFFSRFGATKGGYWFTFALFEFFLLCIFSERYLKKWSGAFAVVISVLAFCYDIYYSRFILSSYNFHFSLFTFHFSITDILGFLSFMTWRYFLFFYVGTWVKRHFEAFVRWTNKTAVIVSVIVGFFAISRIPHSDNIPLECFIFAVGGILGLTMIFTLFRRLSPFTSHFIPADAPTRSLSFFTFHFSLLKLIGTRTLDIYLLHYFFLPRFLLAYAPRLQAYDSRVLEFFVAMLIALIVLALCLLASHIIRLSPFLGHYLFGVTQKSHK